MNGYNFTDRVRKVLQMAREEAARLHHEYVGTEHILLGLIREGEGVAAGVLQNLNVDLEDIQQKIEETVKRGKAAAAAGPDLPYTSRAKKVLELAMVEARELNHSYVGTEHLLLGLLREEKGIAAQVLADAGVSLEQSRAETLRILGSDLPPSAPAAPAGQPDGHLTVAESGTPPFFVARKQWFPGGRRAVWGSWTVQRGARGGRKKDGGGGDNTAAAGRADGGLRGTVRHVPQAAAAPCPRG
ncbi:MAG TPA: Clp protease N-terminal domain-containing protein [Gemmatimonadales bacterium]|nr:Clp protease N-terminal domain-containing protein [Gemmatimonadales bacterium]